MLSAAIRSASAAMFARECITCESTSLTHTPRSSTVSVARRLRAGR